METTVGGSVACSAKHRLPGRPGRVHAADRSRALRLHRDRALPRAAL